MQLHYKYKLGIVVCLVSIIQIFSQQIFEPANWPNSDWTITGNYTLSGLVRSPISTSNFSFDNEVAGAGSLFDNLQAVSPVYDLRSAMTVEPVEEQVVVYFDYINYEVGTSLKLKYTVGDNVWIDWQDILLNSTSNTDYKTCLGLANFISDPQLLISFTDGQLQNFRYAIFYDDNNANFQNGGFCISTPTLISYPLNVDADGDGVLDSQEITDGTDLNNGCDFILANQTVVPSSEWDLRDCDNDGMSNGTEVNNGSDPLVSDVILDPSYHVAVIPFQLYIHPLTTTTNADDQYSSALDLNFNFNFFGNNYSEVSLSTNSVISFSTEDANNYCPWQINSTDTLPNSNVIDNAILGVFQDYDDVTTNNGTFGYASFGTAPFRKFAVLIDDISLYSCATTTSTTQTIIYETYNYIDVQIKDRNVCSTWNGGRAILGIQNIGGTEAYFPEDRNTGTWEAHNEAYRFKPQFNTLDFQYIICDAGVDGVEQFDLNEVITHFELGNDNVYTTFETLVDAENNTNQITSVSSYTNISNSQIIYLREIDNLTGDINIKRVLLATIDCSADYDLDSVSTMDEDLNQNGNFGDDDTDGDEIPDFLDEDDDGDFILTTAEAVITTSRDVNEFLDTDGDSIPNYLDNDDDGDGVLTINEDYDGDNNPMNDDTNNDGIADYLQQSVALGTTNETLNYFSIYPNPVKDNLRITFNGLQNDIDIKIYNIQGQEVYIKNKVVDDLEINVSNLSNGVYFINVINEKQTFIKKFVKK